MTTTMSSKGQIVLPAEIRQRDAIQPGQEFDVERIDCGQYVLKRRTRPRNEGLVKLLLACPVKGFFKPMDRDEVTANQDFEAILIGDCNLSWPSEAAPAPAAGG